MLGTPSLLRHDEMIEDYYGMQDSNANGLDTYETW
jgi:hypothetical protein